MMTMATNSIPSGMPRPNSSGRVLLEEGLGGGEEDGDKLPVAGGFCVSDCDGTVEDDEGFPVQNASCQGRNFSGSLSGAWSG